MSVAKTSSTRLRTCERGLGGRAGTHLFEHARNELRACSPVQTCPSKAERVRRTGSREVHEEATLASSTEDERRSSSKTKAALPLSEAVWRSTPAAAQNHAHLPNDEVLALSEMISDLSGCAARKLSLFLPRGARLSKIFAGEAGAACNPARGCMVRARAQHVPR